MWHSRPLETPPLFMANAILNFHFDFLNPSLRVYDDRWHAFPDLRSCFMYVDGSYGRGKVRGTRFS